MSGVEDLAEAKLRAMEEKDMDHEKAREALRAWLALVFKRLAAQRAAQAAQFRRCARI